MTGRPNKEEATGFGRRLRALREAAGMTQGDLAEKAGMSRSGVIKMELNLREPNWPTVLKLSAALGVDCAAFLGPGEPAPPVTDPEPEPAPKATPKAKPAGKPATKRKER